MSGLSESDAEASRPGQLTVKEARARIATLANALKTIAGHILPLQRKQVNKGRELVEENAKLLQQYAVGQKIQVSHAIGNTPKQQGAGQKIG